MRRVGWGGRGRGEVGIYDQWTIWLVRMRSYSSDSWDILSGWMCEEVEGFDLLDE